MLPLSQAENQRTSEVEQTESRGLIVIKWPIFALRRNICNSKFWNNKAISSPCYS